VRVLSEQEMFEIRLRQLWSASPWDQGRLAWLLFGWLHPDPGLVGVRVLSEPWRQR